MRAILRFQIHFQAMMRNLERAGIVSSDAEIKLRKEGAAGAASPLLHWNSGLSQTNVII